MHGGIENDETYYLVGADSIEQPVLDYIVLQHNRWTENMFSQFISGDTVQMVDVQTGSVFKLGMEGKKTIDYVYNTYSTLVTALLTKDDSAAGRFEYNDLAMLTGTFGGKKIEIIWKPTYQTAEIRTDGKMAALLFDTADQRTLYVSNDQSMAAPDVLKLVAVYDFVFMEQQKLVYDSPPKEEVPLDDNN